MCMYVACGSGLGWDILPSMPYRPYHTIPYIYSETKRHEMKNNEENDDDDDIVAVGCNQHYYSHSYVA